MNKFLSKWLLLPKKIKIFEKYNFGMENSWPFGLCWRPKSITMQEIMKLKYIVDFKLKTVPKSHTEFLLVVNPLKCSLCMDNIFYRQLLGKCKEGCWLTVWKIHKFFCHFNFPSNHKGHFEVSNTYTLWKSTTNAITLKKFRETNSI